MSGLSPERLVELYAQMVRIREFEERVKRTFADHPGVIRGHTHLADGAEASIVGSVAAIGEGDAIMATYRCHGYPIALGSDTAAMMAEIYGRSTGICKGYGGSMHLADPARGFLGTSGIVGQNIPQGTGAAYAAQLRGRGEVALTFFGDGASKQGAFHESLNIAAVWKLPAIFIMENNSFSATVRTEQEDANAAAGEPLSMKAKAYSIPGVTIDGSDLLAGDDAVSEAVARARAGEGPTLIESRVYRLSAHGNSIAPPGVPLHYPEHEAISKYGAVEEYEAAKRGDPIPRFRAHLVETGALTPERATEIIEAAQAEMQRAVEFALESPYPEPHEALAYVHA
jgi:TPP-dependent pyruvate/acetoin dehydrogenase alpha subunit